VNILTEIHAKIIISIIKRPSTESLKSHKNLYWYSKSNRSYLTLLSKTIPEWNILENILRKNQYKVSYFFWRVVDQRKTVAYRRK
jgi:hypothetical protein